MANKVFYILGTIACSAVSAGITYVIMHIEQERQARRIELETKEYYENLYNDIISNANDEQEDDEDSEEDDDPSEQEDSVEEIVYKNYAGFYSGSHDNDAEQIDAHDLIGAASRRNLPIDDTFSQTPRSTKAATVVQENDLPEDCEDLDYCVFGSSNEKAPIKMSDFRTTRAAKNQTPRRVSEYTVIIDVDTYLDSEDSHECSCAIDRDGGMRIIDEHCELVDAYEDLGVPEETMFELRNRYLSDFLYLYNEDSNVAYEVSFS